MSQPTPHILQHIAAIEPRVGKVEVAFRELVLISRDEDHLGVEVGANGIVPV